MKVSIITATYNSEKTLSACLDSVANQSAIADIEHIIVDGRSSDATLTITANYPHISTVISAWDRGIYHAFNRGIELATGDIVYFLNSDDTLFDSEVISHVLAEFSAEYQYYLGTVLCEGPDIGVSYFTVQNDDTNVNSRPCHQGFFCRRKLFERFGSFNECFTIAADMYLMKKIMKHTAGIVTNRAIAKFSLQGMSNQNDNKAAMLRQHSIIDDLLGSDKIQQELPEKLALQMQNVSALKQLLLNVLNNKLDFSRWLDKKVSIFGVRDLSQAIFYLLKQNGVEVINFVVSTPKNVPEGLLAPVIGFNELNVSPVDIVINCIEGKHETSVSEKIMQIKPEAKIVSWRQFCGHEHDTQF